MRLRLLASFLALVLTAGHASAQLEFASKHSRYQAKPTDTQFESSFTFENTGSHPVVIREVDTNCGCILAEADKERYGKGESGTIKAIFKIGGAEGVQTKTVSVSYYPDKSGDAPWDPKAPPYAPAPGDLKTQRLTVELDVPAIIEVEPKIIKWPVGAPSETQKITVTMKHEEPIAIRQVKSSRESVKVEVKEIEGGRLYELLVTPTTTEKVQLGMLTIETDCSIAKHRKKLAFFSVHRPQPAR